MRAQALTRATKEGVSGAAGRLFEISEEFAARCRDSYRDAERGVRRLRIAAEEGVDHTRRQIKAHPLATAALVAGGAFLLGSLVSKRKGRRGWR